MTQSSHQVDDGTPAPDEHRSPGRRTALVVGVAATSVILVGAGWAIGAGRIGGSGEPSSPSPRAVAAPSAATLPSRSPSPSASRPIVGGWYAGASGLGVADGAFEEWLGQPVTIAGTWADQSAAVQERLRPLNEEFRAWSGAMDLAIGGTVLGSQENYAAAARGAYDARWRSAAKNLAARRGDVPAPTFVRPFHEMNGFWYRNWAVNRDNVADYRTAHARYVKILRAAMPTVYISWSPNSGDHSGLPVEQWYPGDDVVDCVAPDYYDDGTTRSWPSVSAWNAEAGDRDSNGNPRGPEAWRQFALQHGKPLCFPETGLKPSGGSTDHPEWIRAFNAWMNTHANTSTWPLGDPIPAEAAGKVLYSVYFNVSHAGNDGFTIHGRGANPKSEKVFRSLKWGRQP